MSNPVKPSQLTLISHKLCPYVQRAVSVLEESGVAYKRIDIDLANKPDWFKTLSPLGKVPVLVVDDDTVIFESAVISEYLNEVYGSQMLSEQPLEKAKQRAWIEFASATINNLGQLYSAPDEQSFLQAQQQLKEKIARLEQNLSDGNYFSGDHFSLMDAAFAPVFRYLQVFETLLGRVLFKPQARIEQWKKQLFLTPSVKLAVNPAYPLLLTEFIAAKDSYLGRIAQQFINLKNTT
jgi:glutathione S-transferase